MAEGRVATCLSPPTMDRLTTLIYHEKQQPGSMLCAQHALNSLLRLSPFSYLIPLTHFSEQKETLSV